MSALTYANLIYIMRKGIVPRKDKRGLQTLRLIFEFVDLSVSDLSHAVEMQWQDFEDAVQSATAERLHADYIITRNVRDFNKSKVLALTPSELLSRI